VTEVLTGYGPLGVAVIGLAWAVVHLYNRNQSLQDKREEEVKTVTEALTRSTAAQDRNADVLEEFANRLPGWISGRNKGGAYR
jgi:hypothetical protein